jgi:hypothetical protein
MLSTLLSNGTSAAIQFLSESLNRYRELDLMEKAAEVEQLMSSLGGWKKSRQTATFHLSGFAIALEYSGQSLPVPPEIELFPNALAKSPAISHDPPNCWWVLDPAPTVAPIQPGTNITIGFRFDLG